MHKSIALKMRRFICISSRRPGLLHAVLTLAIVATLASCKTAPEETHEAPTHVMIQDNGIMIYLNMMQQLGSGDPAEQADIFYAVERDYTSAPTTANSLRYGAALVTAGHPATDLQKGRLVLQTLLATPERMSPAERTLAQILLNEVESRLRLEADNSRLVATVDGRQRSQANSDRRTQAMAEENARLRKALEDAQQKLDKIRDIERSIIERTPSPPGSPPSAGNRDSLPETQSPPAGR
jgi:hypothetical protein